MIVLGVDWGRKRAGVAVSDEMGILSHPLTTLEINSQKDLALALARLAQEKKAETIVLGLPQNMDGTEGESARAVRSLAEELEKSAGCAVVLRDERLTSWESARFLSEEARVPSKKQKKIKDQMAACLILQGYLDDLKSHEIP